MLILEGPDMVGKTTLMPLLEDLVYDEVVEMGDESVEVTTEKYGLDEANYTTAEQWLARIKPWNICDRFVLSERMYGAAARGKPNVDYGAYQRVMREVRARGGAVIVVCASEERYEQLIKTVYPTRGEAFSESVCRAVNRMYLGLEIGEDCDVKIVLEDGRYADEVAMGQLEKVCWSYARAQTAQKR